MRNPALAFLIAAAMVAVVGCGGSSKKTGATANTLTILSSHTWYRNYDNSDFDFQPIARAQRLTFQSSNKLNLRSCEGSVDLAYRIVDTTHISIEIRNGTFQSYTLRALPNQLTFTDHKGQMMDYLTNPTPGGECQ